MGRDILMYTRRSVFGRQNIFEAYTLDLEVPEVFNFVAFSS